MIAILVCQIVLARVKYSGGGDWYNDKDAIPNLAAQINARTSLRVATEEKVVSLTDPDLPCYPFLFLTGHGRIRLTDEERKALRKYIEGGGFLYADDDYGMDEFFRQEIKRVFPDKELEEVPFDHPIYHIFYDLEGPPKIHEHYEGPPKGYGIFIGGRLAVYYTYNSNVSDGWTSAHGDPQDVREQAFRMGINMVLYAVMY
ncbi:MAG: DUF4159 domain-containing protein [candidate division WOR-3 bacterium]